MPTLRKAYQRDYLLAQSLSLPIPFANGIWEGFALDLVRNYGKIFLFDEKNNLCANIRI